MINPMNCPRLSLTTDHYAPRPEAGTEARPTMEAPITKFSFTGYWSLTTISPVPPKTRFFGRFAFSE